jgi:methyl-accepting chemotaxis protein
MVRMAAPFSLDKLLRYGPTVLDAAGQAWDRVKQWRSAREAAPASAEPKERGEGSEREEGSLSLQQLTQAVASQSELVKQLAEQANGMTNALSELASRVNRVEEQTKQQLARTRAELAGHAARSRWAMTIAGLSLVLAGLLAALPYLSRYF